MDSRPQPRGHRVGDDPTLLVQPVHPFDKGIPSLLVHVVRFDLFAVAGNRLQSLPAHPALDTGSSQCGDDDPDGNLLLQMDIAGEKIGHGRTVAHTFRSAYLPSASGNVPGGGEPAFLGSLEKTNGRPVGPGQLPFHVLDPGPHPEIHVGLPGSEPDFADKDITAPDLLVFAAHGQFTGFESGGLGREADLPSSGRITAGSAFGTAEPHRHLGSRARMSPNREGNIPLEDRMIGKGRSQHKICTPAGPSEQEDRTGQNNFFHRVRVFIRFHLSESRPQPPVPHRITLRFL